MHLPKSIRSQIIDGDAAGRSAKASAILNRSGEVVGAIGMSGPDSRINRKQAGHTISFALGYVLRD